MRVAIVMTVAVLSFAASPAGAQAESGWRTMTTEPLDESLSELLDNQWNIEGTPIGRNVSFLLRNREGKYALCEMRPKRKEEGKFESECFRLQ